MKMRLWMVSAWLLAVAWVSPRAVASSLTLEFAHSMAGQPLKAGASYITNAAGQEFTVTRVNYLLSEFVLTRANGENVVLTNQYGLVQWDEGRVQVPLQDVPEGNYISLAFRVGLPPQVNHGDPGLYPAGHPLNPLVNQMHWSWQGGYIFVALEGRYRTETGDESGYSYHLATDSLRMQVEIPAEFALPNTQVLAITTDLSGVLLTNGVEKISAKLGTDSTHSGAGDVLAPLLAKKFADAFQYNGTGLNRVPTENPPGPQAPNHNVGTPLQFTPPATFPQAQWPQDNLPTVQGVALGKRLFFDPQLSRDRTQSCASCHEPQNAFAHRGQAVSLGVDGLPGKRNAMPIFNLLWNRDFFWDGRAKTLREQVLMPIQDPLEMHVSLEEVVSRVARDATYAQDWQAAFGHQAITAELLAKALEQYLFTLTAADSKFDRAARGEMQFTELEKRGLQLFITEYDPAREKYGADCFHCHGGFLFTDYAYRNNGLEKKFQDLGRAMVTGSTNDWGKFKTPSLRNVELTGPFMHDGRFATLEEVVDHYSTGVVRTATLDPNLAKHPAGGLQLSAEDKQALVAFLKTLTDLP